MHEAVDEVDEAVDEVCLFIDVYRLIKSLVACVLPQMHTSNTTNLE